ncbi:MEDS domain-containing protein [Pedococcus sp. 5OH_020]|uniref:MEDS domain-containing protein n=1 Tax=Pedococcus sp. 5OH_020 TaxID=2989814 RepID=UPI0022E9D24A|nr:MEDS domain-containing protein [Pedococcus sp. 5OH_020]
MSFYDRDDDLVADLAAFADEGLGAGDRVIVLATPEHRSDIERTLLAHAADALDDRRYICLDAAQTLATFMAGDQPDRDRFDASVGALIDEAGTGGRRVRVFGEMVAVLWGSGNVSGAIAVESLWNDLRAGRDFSLLCAYPTAVLEEGGLGELDQVCGLHSDVHAPYLGPVGGDDSVRSAGPVAPQQSRVFVPAPEVVLAVRRFVGRVLADWHLDELAGDVCLVASEVATNAVVHARSPFRLFVHHTDDMVLLAVKDSRPGEAAEKADSEVGLSGRGLRIVAALAHRWGCTPLPEGKVIWAEFPFSPPARSAED